MGERVLVIKRSLLESLGVFQGSRGGEEAKRYLRTILENGNHSFIPRPVAEQDESMKQVIPYVVLVHRDAVFVYTRSRGGQEERLQGFRSIGIGGHISEEDWKGQSDPSISYSKSLRREVCEEVALDSTFVDRLVGLINEDATEVGKVHFGIVHLWVLAARAVEPRESAIGRAEFIPIGDVLDMGQTLEPWSRIAIKLIGEETGHPAKS